MSDEEFSLDDVVAFETGDGSMTLHDRERNIHYRSRHGAIQESKHVFLEGTDIAGRDGIWRVVELGFGAAVNFVQTVEAFRASPRAIRLVYHSVDWRPVTPEHLDFYGEIEESDDDEELVPKGPRWARQALEAVHGGQGPVATVESEDQRVVLHLHAKPWEEAQLTGLGAQAFYQDPFSKRVNPESWTADSFKRAKKAMATDGRLATYSAATSVKTALFEAGFSVASASGPGRKREMTVASPSKSALERDERLELLERGKYLG